MATARSSKEPSPRRRRPASTPEERELQLTGLAVDLAEKQLREGTASAQVMTHFLKLATARENLEREKLRKENILLEKRAQQMDHGQHSEQLMREALDAFRGYSGKDVEEFAE